MKQNTPESPQSVMKQYGACPVTATRGFLPDKDPLHCLPSISTLNNKLNELAQSIPVLLQKKQLRNEINKLHSAFLNQEIAIDIENPQQESVAILILLMLMQAYLFEDIDNPINIIPGTIATNLYRFCKDKQRFPTLTYADYILQNWRLKNTAEEMTLDNIEPLFTMTDSKDEAWFIKIHIAIEAISGKALDAAFKSYVLADQMLSDETHHESEEKLSELLHEMKQSIDQATVILTKMVEGCDPDYYWNVLRHYLIGPKNIKVPISEGKEEVGIRFEGVETGDKIPTHNYDGPSGAQSSILPALDAALGIKHQIDSMYQMLLTMQQYMPMDHQLFINLMRSSRVEIAVKHSHSKQLGQAWKEAIHAIQQLRKEHLVIIDKYIYQPAAKQGSESSTLGTGGAPIKTYLGGRYKSTEETGNSLDLE